MIKRQLEHQKETSIGGQSRDVTNAFIHDNVLFIQIPNCEIVLYSTVFCVSRIRMSHISYAYCLD